MKTKQITLTTLEFENSDEFSALEKETIEACKKAADTAWAPYSGFHVGAAVLLDNGEIVTGSNQENAAYPSGLCAERVALFAAHSKYPKSKALCLAVCAQKDGTFLDQPVSPCGSCRQVITESNTRFGSPMKVILYGSEKIVAIENSNDLLPLRFDSSSF
ncbi:cytidine deaminase [Saccharicrinis sp. FJH2]|uniref:cytidine deaminase n=1 Tax=unclassified Saccharicrinis TaxID=2646859 RepID=UPI0035D45D1B